MTNRSGNGIENNIEILIFDGLKFILEVFGLQTSIKIAINFGIDFWKA